MDPSIKGNLSTPKAPLWLVLKIGKEATSNKPYSTLSCLSPLFRHSQELIYDNAKEAVEDALSEFHGTLEETFCHNTAVPFFIRCHGAPEYCIEAVDQYIDTRRAACTRPPRREWARSSTLEFVDTVSVYFSWQELRVRSFQMDLPEIPTQAPGAPRLRGHVRFPIPQGSPELQSKIISPAH